MTVIGQLSGFYYSDPSKGRFRALRGLIPGPQGPQPGATITDLQKGEAVVGLYLGLKGAPVSTPFCLYVCKILYLHPLGCKWTWKSKRAPC